MRYRRIRFGYPFRKIPLTQGKFAVVDPQDYDELAKFNWRLCRTKGKNTLYAERSIRKPNGKFSRLLMHRQILQIHEFRYRGPNSAIKNSKLTIKNCHRLGDGIVIDHINRNGLDNRNANLRLATISQNAANSKKRNNRSGYKGVWLDKKKGLFRTAVCKNNKRYYLGYFKNAKDAAKAYDKAAKKYHGQFARLNFPKK